MSHRKSIPVQHLLYFHNFLEFPYFFRGSKFKYIYFYNQILMFFIYIFFVNIFGFSINMLHIDYLKDSINIYIDFLNVSYRVRVGKAYNKKKFIYLYRRHFLLNIFKSSGSILHKWLDRYVYMMLLFHKSGSLPAYRSFINCLCMYNRYSGVVLALRNSNKSISFVFDNSFHCIFSLLFFFLFSRCYYDFQFFIYWFYCFFAYLFSLVYKNSMVFRQICYKTLYTSNAKHENKLNATDATSHLKLIDFIYMYNLFYINISLNSSFLLYYLKYFFIFLFYNFIFFNTCWSFCFLFFNYFKYICYCWPSLKLYKNLYKQFNHKFVLKKNINKCYYVYNLEFNVFYRNMISLFNSYALGTYTFLEFGFTPIVFIFHTFFINLYFVFKYNICSPKLIVSKYKALWYSYGRITLLSFTLGTSMHNIVNVDEYHNLSTLGMFYRLRRYRFKSKLHRFSTHIRTFKIAYGRLCQECFFRRFNYVGFLFKRFFNLNTFTITFFRRFSCGFFSKINFHFMFYFIYKVEFIFQLLVQCNCKDLFFYYLSFFFKNWYFFNNIFFKYVYSSKRGVTVKKKKNMNAFYFIFFSKKFLRYFCKYFGRKLRNILFFFSKKKLKYLYSFSIFGFSRYKWYNLDKLSIFNNPRYSIALWKYVKNMYILAISSNTMYFSKFRISAQFVNKCRLLWSYYPIASFKVISCNFGNILARLVNSIIYNQFRIQYHSDANIYRKSLQLLSNLRFQIHCNFSELYVYSFLLEFNLKFLKGLSLLFCFFHFNIDFFFKFYINIYFMNFIYFCEFFYFIFSMKLLFNFYFLKLHLSDYRFCGFLGLYLLIFKFSKDYINITGAYILNYLFDIFFNVFMTNRYRSIKYILLVLSNLFVDFLDLQKFCGFNFKIKGRMSKRTQRKQCFIINRGVLKLTENNGNLFSGKRTLNTHIGSVSIYLYINMKIC